MDDETRDAGTTTEGTTSAGAEPTPDQTAEPPAKAPRKRASRKKAAAPQQAPPTADEPAGAPTAADEPADTPGAAVEAVAASPTARAPRKRARKATAPAATPTVPADTPPEQAPTADDAGAPAAEPAEPPPPSPRRKRARATRPAAAPVASEPDAQPDAQPEPVPAAGPGETPAEEDESEGAAGEPATEEAAAATVPFAPLFQAPQPTTPRRRRAATRPAGAPVPAAQGEPSAEQPTGPTDDEGEQAAPTGGRRRRSRSRGAAAQEAAAAEEAGADAPAEAASADDDDEDAQGDGARDDAGEEQDGGRRKRRRGGRGRRRRSGDDDAGGDTAAEGEVVDEASAEQDEEQQGDGEQAEEGGGSRRRRRRRRRAGGGDEASDDDPPNTVTKVRSTRSARDEVVGVKGSTRLEAKRQRRREGRESGRRKQVITEAEFLARREAVERTMVMRSTQGRTQIVVLEDGVLVEHYVARKAAASMIGNVYLGKVQNVLPSMEAAFVDIGKGRNAVLYAGEVNWDAAGLEGQPRRIELALRSGDPVLVQVSKDPVGHKGARLTSQVSLPGRYLVYVPDSSMTGISRKLPDTERSRLKKILKAVVPDHAGVIVRTAAEGASEAELERDVQRLQTQWEKIEKKAKAANPPAMLHGEPDLTTKVVRDVFNEDFASLLVSGDDAWSTVKGYVDEVAPDLSERVTRWEGEGDVFAAHRVDEQIAKALDRKVFLPSGGSLVIDRTEAMTVVDVNTGKFVGSGGNLEETVTRNNLEAAEEIVRQLRLRDVGGIIVIDFIDMVLEANRDLVLRRLTECLGRDRTKHQVAEVTSLGLVQMTRKRVGQGLLEAFSEPCEHCQGSGVTLHDEPIERKGGGSGGGGGDKTADKDPAKAEQARRASAEAHKVHEAARKAMERARGASTDDGEAVTAVDADEVAEQIVAEVVAAASAGEEGPAAQHARTEDGGSDDASTDDASTDDAASEDAASEDAPRA